MKQSDFYASLLGRKEIQLPVPKELLENKRILVTGGAGSIGSELCRQIASVPVRELTIIDISENNAYALQQELQTARKIPLSVEIASVRDQQQMFRLFEKHRPDVVFHAAAHKHVPLMEACPGEAIKNNIFGTLHVLKAAKHASSERFLLISTDKAVYPSSVMGASKRFAEVLTAQDWGKTICTTVRFGNVMGSAGSVLPLFQRQIDEGGPVLVTDPRMVRYFMTIPEAVSLVLQAAAQAESRELFVLDMGEPISILSLAQALIRHTGKDIPIQFIGLRPGEKLSEELLTADEKKYAVPTGRLLRIQVQHTVSEDKLQNLLQLLESSLSGTPRQQIAALHEAVPEFTSSPVV